MRFKLLILLPWLILSQNAWSEEVYIVANKDLNVSSIDKKELTKIYLGKSSMLESSKIEPLALPSDSKDHIYFTENILNKDPQKYERYWARLVFTGKGNPPKVISQENERLSYVKNNREAIFYTMTPPKDTGIKVISIK